MTDRYQKQWEQLGNSDPYWAVLTDPDKKGNKWQQEEFFRTGETEIRQVLNRLEIYGIQCNFEQALDFGCGVGRLSRALAGHFREVLAIDVSASMLEEAQSVNRGYDNIRFIHNTAQDLAVIADQSLHFIYSNIVLQHMPARHQKRYIKEFCRTLAGGGVMVFQTPSNFVKGHWRTLFDNPPGNILLNKIRSFKYGKHGVMEMHPLPKAAVEFILQEARLEIIAMEAYNYGPLFESYRYFARKPE